jgi:hypothetical protein
MTENVELTAPEQVQIPRLKFELNLTDPQIMALNLLFVAAPPTIKMLMDDPKIRDILAVPPEMPDDYFKAWLSAFLPCIKEMMLDFERQVQEHMPSSIVVKKRKDVPELQQENAENLTGETGELTKH